MVGGRGDGKLDFYFGEYNIGLNPYKRGRAVTATICDWSCVHTNTILSLMR